MRHAIFSLCVLVLSSPAAFAASKADIDALFSALDMGTMYEIMRDEGLAYGDTLAEEMLPGGSAPGWQDVVARIHDVDKMDEIVRTGFTSAFGDTDAAPLLQFFQSADGQQVVAREVETRRAFLDDAVSDQATEMFRAMQEPYDDRMGAIQDYIEVNDLIEYNVMGSLNSNFAFYRGLAEGGAYEMSEEDMLRDVWAQEQATREDTRDWVYGFLMMAYAPLSPDVINRYAELSKTEAGQALNRALFAGFDEMYNTISLSLGMALARQMDSEAL